MEFTTDSISVGKTEYLDTPDGFRLRACVFLSARHTNNGTVILLHGRNEAVEKYDHVIADLCARGLDVVTFDWRGQGRSSRFFRDGRRGYVDSFEQYATDLETVFTHLALPEARPPFYVLAHSMGGLAALYSAPRLVNRLRRMVLSCPFVGLSDTRLTTGQLHTIASVLTFLGLGKAYVGGGPAGSARIEFSSNRLTSDRTRFERNKTLLDPVNGLGLGGPTAAWLRACTHAMQTITDPEHLSKIFIPTLLIGGGADTIVPQPALEDYAARLRSGAMVIIDGSRHEPMQEAAFYREQFFAAFDAFIPGSQ